ncbi:tetratricopeptide repeat protein [Streptomyces sp. NPDC005921]|uniref:tetratricopeptide repeat protein n=1 Tax=Streptomyces sp. NPDC005827 TaxID=3157070 RepID=UPI0033C5E21A
MSELGARASGQGRIFQTTGDQHIEEHHHHYDAGAAPLFGAASPSWPVSPAGPDSVRVPLVGRPPGILRDREELLGVLTAVLTQTGGDAHVVHGMGGCGKTALAYWFFTEAVRAHGRTGFWVNASERMSLRAGMLAVAGDQGATAGELAAAAAGQRAASDVVWHYLGQAADPWLLVLDNADDPGILEDGAWLRTSPRGMILVTTRHAGSPLWRGPGVTRHALDVLPLDHAAQVLCDLAPDAGDLESARRVAERLGRLPLALTLAGSHLAHQLLESWSMDEYDRKLAEESTAIVDRGATGHGNSQSRHLVGRTWQLSLNTLTEQGLPEATTLLRLLSCWAADPVPLDALAPLAQGATALGELEPARVEPALRALLDHSLAELVLVSDGVRCVRAHGVLLDSVAAGVPEEGRPALVETAARLLEAALPESGTASPEVRDRLGLLAPHASALLRTAPGERTVTLAVRVARRVFDSGDFAGALGLAPEVADRGEALLGVRHPVALEAREVEARALFRMGHYPESEELHRRVLARRELVLGPDHPDTLRSCVGLHQPLDLQDNDEEAERLLRRALEGQRRVLGEHAPETLFTWVYLAEVLPQLGKESEFRAEAGALTETCERVLPPDDLTTVGAYHSYGLGLVAFERYEEAEPIAHRVLADRTRLQGAGHPVAVSALSLNAVVARGLGRHREALTMLRRVAELREQALGPDHPFVAYDRERLTAWEAEAGA